MEKELIPADNFYNTLNSITTPFFFYVDPELTQAENSYLVTATYDNYVVHDVTTPTSHAMVANEETHIVYAYDRYDNLQDHLLDEWRVIIIHEQGEAHDK